MKRLQRTIVADSDAARHAIARLDDLASAESELRRIDEQIAGLGRIRALAADRVMEARFRVVFGDGLTDRKRPGVFTRREAEEIAV